MRTVLNPLAGTLSVPVRTFVLRQVVGGLAGSVGVTLCGYILRKRRAKLDSAQDFPRRRGGAAVFLGPRRSPPRLRPPD